MASGKTGLTVTGVTTDGRKVIGGVFQFFDTVGVPLDVMFSYLDDNDMQVDWIDFIEAAFNQGWQEKTIRSRLREAIPDVYGPDFYKGWEARFEAYLTGRGSTSSPRS